MFHSKVSLYGMDRMGFILMARFTSHSCLWHSNILLCICCCCSTYGQLFESASNQYINVLVVCQMRAYCNERTLKFWYFSTCYLMTFNNYAAWMNCRNRNDNSLPKIFIIPVLSSGKLLLQNVILKLLYF